ncbi:MAG TPA: hypothetical protein VHT26_07710 [Trebonia sp.]|nr:hypothetical protein [Trebonia sp.]
MRSASLNVPLLSGSLVRLESLSAGHLPNLMEALEEDRATYGSPGFPAP